MPSIKATHRLMKLSLNRVAVVPQGANSAAHIQLYKSAEEKPEGGKVMNFEELMKSLPEDQQAVVIAEIEKAKAEVKPVEKQAEPTFEELLKGADPAVVKAYNEMAAAVQLQKEAVEKDRITGIEKEAKATLAEFTFAKACPGLEESFVTLAKENPAIKATVETLLKSVDALVKENDIIFKEIGADGGEGADAEAKIEQMAKERAVKDGISFEKAYTVVLKENPDFYAQLEE